MSRLDSRARKLIELRDKYNLAKREADAAKLERDNFEMELWSELEDLGLKSFTMDDGTQVVRPQPTIYADVVDEEAFIDWAKANGLEDEFTTEGLRKKSLNGFVRTRIESGEELPPGMSYRVDRGIRITKPKN